MRIDVLGGQTGPLELERKFEPENMQAGMQNGLTGSNLRASAGDA
jgi:hypothetical protein